MALPKSLGRNLLINGKIRLEYKKMVCCLLQRHNNMAMELCVQALIKKNIESFFHTKIQHHSTITLVSGTRVLDQVR